MYLFFFSILQNSLRGVKDDMDIKSLPFVMRKNTGFFSNVNLLVRNWVTFNHLESSQVQLPRGLTEKVFYFNVVMFVGNF